MKSIAILGAGESGTAAALLAQKNNIAVFVSEYGQIAEEYKIDLQKNKIPFEEEGHKFEKLVHADLVIKSPGIPDSAPIVVRLRKTGVKIISEIEFACLFYHGKVIGVTGSNGKTTTVSWVYHVLQQAELKVGLGGNIGYSFSRLLLDDRDYDWLVLELSSFQLDDIDSFAVDIGVILNVSPDHLDRYNYSMYKYASAKWNLATAIRENGSLILNEDDEWLELMQVALPQSCNRIFLSYDQPIIICDSKESLNKIEIKKLIQLRGHHNLFNAAVTHRVCREVGLSDEEIRQSLGSFGALEHRLETVDVIDGVTYINDSKATNVESTIVALEAIDGRIIWIAGGTDKGNDYSVMQNLVRDHVDVIICLTKDDRALRQSFSNCVEQIFTTKDVDDCISIARQCAREGTVVLLSPACASFDLFDNYIDRGNKFKAAVLRRESE